MQRTDVLWRRGTRLDRFVERVKDMHRPNMVSSRVYSFGGADDVVSLQESQLELLAVLANSDWDSCSVSWMSGSTLGSTSTAASRSFEAV